MITRGGGSAEDLMAFSHEQVVRAVAASRVPTLVAIGHEVDISLAELAADVRGSTPSNAAELLVPDREYIAGLLGETRTELTRNIAGLVHRAQTDLQDTRAHLSQSIQEVLVRARLQQAAQKQLLEALSPQAILSRGYAMVHKQGKLVRAVKGLAASDIIEIRFADGSKRATVE
jgi:exodeoxyribonuclease VII large subunit